MRSFSSSAAKDWIRMNVDLAPIKDLASSVRGRGEAVGYIGTPGPGLQDVLAWRRYLDYAIACEKDPRYLRDLKFNVRRQGLDEGFLRATGMSIEDVLTNSGRDLDVFKALDQWPSLLNYDVYANPVLPRWGGFRRDDGLWRGLRGYLAAVRESLPGLLMVVTTNMRGKTSEYDAAIQSIFDELEGYDIRVRPSEQRSFLDGSMAKKYQICVPYWLSRFAATAQGFYVDLVESLDYIGTSNVRMMHMIAKLTATESDAQAPELSLLRLVNFPHRSLTKTSDGFGFSPSKYPIISHR